MLTVSGKALLYLQVFKAWVACTSDRNSINMQVAMERWWNGTDRVNLIAARKPVPLPPCSQQLQKRNGPGRNPFLPVEMPATKSH